MRRYTYSKNRKSRKERIGFITAFSICLVAIGLALLSTYASIGGFDNKNVTEPTYVATFPRQTAPVEKEMTGITVEATETVVSSTAQERMTIPEGTMSDPVEGYTGDSEDVQTMLQVFESLGYPVTSRNITKAYSTDAVYNSTMGDYRAHTGADFEADIGENVIAMSDGIVESIYSDPMYGNTIIIRNGNFSVYYCGLSETMYCVEGSSVSKGDIIGKVGEIPCEENDGMHLHVEVRVGDKSIDPLSVMGSDE